MPENLTPHDFKIIASKNKVVTDEGSEVLGGTIGGMGTTPVSDLEDVIDEDGNVDAEKIGGTIPPANINLASRGWIQTSAFSVTDADTVTWGAGTFTAADGTAYSIGSGNTGNMSAKTFIYLDIAVSTTAYQTTTTAATAVGAGKALIAVAENGTGEATFFVLGGGGQNIKAEDIVANSITANELSTSITYAGAIVIDSAGLIRSGQTAYDTGTGWWIGNDGGTPKLSIGDPTADYARWSGVVWQTSRDEKRIVVQAGAGTLGSGATEGVVLTSTPAIFFADNARQNYLVSGLVPQGAGGLAISSIQVYYWNEDGGVSKNVMLKVMTSHVAYADGGTRTQDHTGTERVYATNGTDATVGVFTLNADVYNGLPATVAAGELICAIVERVGDDASDTYGAAWKMLGVVINFA